MDLADLESQLKAAAGARARLITTDGVFSMDGHVAPLAEICALADKYNAVRHRHSMPSLTLTFFLFSLSLFL
jgi:glycine C-acetyltransferase